MTRSIRKPRWFVVGMLALALALGGLLSQPAGTLAVGGKMHLEDVSLGIITDKARPKLSG
jgi:hypothetical protein